jgi:chromosome segregation ATPase
MAGSGRRDKSAPISLFSGLLFCDECGNPFVVSGKVERGGRFLKCKTFRYERRRCSCSLGIDEALLETRLVEHLVSRMLAHEPLESAIECFHEALNAQILSAEETQRRAEASSATLLREQNRLGKERENIIASLRELGPIQSLKSEFTRIEGRLKQLEDILSPGHKGPPPKISTAEDFVAALGEASRQRDAAVQQLNAQRAWNKRCLAGLRKFLNQRSEASR